MFASVCETLEAEQGKLAEEDKTCIRRRLLFFLACSDMVSPEFCVRPPPSFTPPSKILGARVPLALAEYDAAHRAESGLPLDSEPDPEGLSSMALHEEASSELKRQVAGGSLSPKNEARAKAVLRHR